MMKLGRVDALY